MCSRFENIVGPDSLNKRYGILAPLGYRASTDIRPDNEVLIVTAAGAALRRWGLKAPWDNRLIINARAETVAQKSTFRRLLDSRCLIPATAWYEWQAVPGAKRKRKHVLMPADGQSFAFAGLTDGERVVMLTRAPAPEIVEIHDRMPAVLALEDEPRWIDPQAGFDQVRHLLDGGGTRYASEPVDDAPPPPKRQPDLLE